MANKRRRFSGPQKVQIIREHLLDAVPISQVCKKYGITPTQFYQWQKMLFENGAALPTNRLSKRRGIFEKFFHEV